MPGAGFRNRGKVERKEIYDTLEAILGRNFTDTEREKIKTSLLNYVRSEVFVFIAKSDTDKNEFLRSK
jgi:hypothetical protein